MKFNLLNKKKQVKTTHNKILTLKPKANRDWYETSLIVYIGILSGALVMLIIVMFTTDLI